MGNEILLQLLSLIPTVAAAAVIIRMLVELAKKLGWVAEDTATYWSLGLNAATYGILMLTKMWGYDTQVNDAFAWANAHINELTAVLSLVALLATSVGATKVFHEALKVVNLWWTNLGAKE